MQYLNPEKSAAWQLLGTFASRGGGVRLEFALRCLEEDRAAAT